MSDIVQEKGGTVLWSRVYYMSGIVYLSPLQMLLFFEFCGLATCLPIVVTGPGWLSMIGIGFVMMMMAFITIKSSLVPLIEGLCAQIYFRFEISVVCSHLLLFFFVKEKTC